MRLLLTAAFVALLSAPVSAHEAKAGAVTVVHPLLRASIGKVPNTAGYLTLKNAGSLPDRLLSASCPCARSVEPHTMEVSGGQARMRPAPIVVPAKGEATLKPGGAHLMLTGLKAPLEAGTVTSVTLVFERAGKVTAPFFVTSRVDEELKSHGAQAHH